MAFSGVSDRDNLIPLLRRMTSSRGEVLKFAVAASGPKDGLLYLSKKDKLKKDDVRNAAETEEVESDAKSSTAPSAKPTIAADLVAHWKEKAAAWGPSIKAAIAAKGATTGDITKLLAQATSPSKPGGDLAQALDKLTACHALATAAGNRRARCGESDQSRGSVQGAVDGVAFRAQSGVGDAGGDEAKLRASALSHLKVRLRPRLLASSAT